MGEILFLFGVCYIERERVVTGEEEEMMIIVKAQRYSSIYIDCIIQYSYLILYLHS